MKWIKWCVGICLIALVLLLVATKTPNGYHFILMNFSGGPIKDVKLKMPWGEYDFTELPAMQPGEHWKLHKVRFQPFWMGDGEVSLSGTTSSGAKIFKDGAYFYFQGGTDSCIVVEIIVEANGVVTIRERPVSW